MIADLKAYTVEFAGEKRVLNVPADNVRVEISMHDFPAVPDLPAAIINALENPIGRPPLSKSVKAGDKVALFTGDRLTDAMLGTKDGIGFVILDHFNSLGVRDEDVTLIYAGGMHDNRFAEQRLGQKLMSRVKTVIHNAFDESSLAFRGVTSYGNPIWINRIVAEADYRLGVGEISPSIHGGWCGGGKLILPGVAGRMSIEQNHQHTLAPLNTYGLVETNPMRLDIEEAAGLANLDMKLDILVNSKAQVVDVYAGDFRREFRAALPKAREIWMTRMDEPVDIAVVYPGELRERILSNAMWMSLEACELATKANGIIIYVLSAADGWADGMQMRHDMHVPAHIARMSREQLASMLVRKEGNIRNVSMLYSAKKVLANRRVYLVSEGIDAEDARLFGFSYSTRSFDDALGKAFSELGRDATVAMSIQRGIGWRVGPWVEG